MGKGSPKRNFRVPDRLWEKALTRSQWRGETLSDVLRRALAEYVGEDPDSADRAACVQRA